MSIKKKSVSSYDLKKALVAVWEHHNEGLVLDALVAERGLTCSDSLKKEAADVARGSHARCYFCNVARGDGVPPKKVDWETFELCACLSEFRTERPTEEWHLQVPGAAGLLALLKAVDARAIVDSEPVLTRACGAAKKGPAGEKLSCDVRWTLRAGSVAHAIRTYVSMQNAIDRDRGIQRTPLEILESFTWPRKCKTCRDAAKARIQTQGDRAAPPTARQRDRMTPAQALANALRGVA